MAQSFPYRNIFLKNQNISYSVFRPVVALQPARRLPEGEQHAPEEELPRVQRAPGADGGQQGGAAAEGAQQGALVLNRCCFNISVFLVWEKCFSYIVPGGRSPAPGWPPTAPRSAISRRRPRPLTVGYGFLLERKETFLCCVKSCANFTTFIPASIFGASPGPPVC